MQDPHGVSGGVVMVLGSLVYVKMQVVVSFALRAEHLCDGGFYVLYFAFIFDTTFHHIMT